jgi:phage gp36-like protein
MAYLFITQTWTGTPAGDITNRINSQIIAKLCPDGAGGVDSTIADSCCFDGEADVSSLLGPQYVMPIDKTTAAATIIIRCAAAMSIYYMYDRAPEFFIDGKNPYQARYDHAKECIKELKAGDRDFGIESAERSAAVGGTAYEPAIGTRFILDDLESGGF